MTVRGIDVSRFQVTTPTLVGLSFAFVRASIGLTVDPAYVMHTRNLEGAGLVDCAYHFGEGNSSPAQQVATFLAAASGPGPGVDTPDLYALDLESSSTPMTRGEAAAFIAAMHAAGHKCGRYGSLSTFGPSLGEDFRWIADWSSTPPPIPWDFWQYQGSPLDSDLWRGSLAELLTLAGRTDMLPTIVPDTLCDVTAGPGYAEDLKTVLLPPTWHWPGVATYGASPTHRAVRVDFATGGADIRTVYFPVANVTNVRPGAPDSTPYSSADLAAATATSRSSALADARAALAALK